MAKSSFAKPGAPKPAAAPVGRGPSKPAAQPAKAPAAKPTPSKVPGVPAGRAQPPAPAKPTPTPPKGVKTNVEAAAPRPAPRRAPAVEVPAEVVDEGAEATGSEVAVIEQADLTNLMTAPLGQIAGELDENDYEIPFLKLMQSTSPDVEDGIFTSGDIVAAKSVILWQDGCEDVELTFLRTVKRWAEQLEYGSEEFPRIFNSAAEAMAAGLQVGDRYGENAAAPQLDAIILVKKPDGVTDEMGIFDREGPDQVLYARLAWRVTGTAYRDVMQKMTAALRLRLKEGLHTGSFKLSARKIKGTKNTYWGPTLNPGDAHDDDMLGFVAESAGE